MITVGKPRRWRGFTDSTEQLQNSSSACREKADGTYESAMPYCSYNGFTAWLLLGRDFFLRFQNHAYATLPSGGNCSLLIQPTNTETDYHVRYVGKDTVRLTSHPCILMVMLVRADNRQ